MMSAQGETKCGKPSVPSATRQDKACTGRRIWDITLLILPLDICRIGPDAARLIQPLAFFDTFQTFRAMVSHIEIYSGKCDEEGTDHISEECSDKRLANVSRHRQLRNGCQLGIPIYNNEAVTYVGMEQYPQRYEEHICDNCINELAQ